MPDTAAPVADALLPDGSTVRVRPVEPADGPELERLLDGLSFRSRWFRFFSGAADVEAAARLAAKAPGVVAVAGEPGHIVGHALLAPEGPGKAEIAFEVGVQRIGLLAADLGGAVLDGDGGHLLQRHERAPAGGRDRDLQPADGIGVRAH